MSQNYALILFENFRSTYIFLIIPIQIGIVRRLVRVRAFWFFLVVARLPIFVELAVLNNRIELELSL